MNPPDDPFELGRRISAARGYAQIQRPELGERLGVDVKQAGGGGDGSAAGSGTWQVRTTPHLIASWAS